MKIAVDCRMSGKSGIGTFLDGILPYLLKSENDFLLLTEKNLPAFTEKNVEQIVCSIKTFSLKEIFFFPPEIKDKINGCDIYFSPYCNLPSGIKIPVFTTIHDVVFLDVPGLAGKIGTLIRKAFYARAVKKSKAVFTVSEFSKERIKAHLKCEKPLYVVYNGVPSYIENEAAEKEEKRSKDKTILFIGNIKKHKGLSTLLKAFSIFREKSAQNQDSQENSRPGLLPELLIVGSQENFRTKDETLSSLLAENSAGIKFTGWLPDSELKKLIQAARLLVQPSLYEGFGIPPLQALYSGTKAVISDIPVFKEIYEGLPVTFFKTGDSEDLAEKIWEVWNDESPLGKVERKYSYKKTAQMILEKLV